MVEHSLGKGEVLSSILSGSTSKSWVPPGRQRFGASALHEIPLPAAAEIAGYLAFDTARVDLFEGMKV